MHNTGAGQPHRARRLQALLGVFFFTVYAAVHAATTPKDSVMKQDEDQAAGMTSLGKITGIGSRDEELVRVLDHLWVSKDVSDSILVTTQEGSVVINSGMPGNGGAHRERFRAQSDAPIDYLVVTQCHGDHFGGAHELKDPATKIITHDNYAACRGYWRDLADFYGRRSNKLWGSVLGKRSGVQDQLREIEADITFRDDYRFTLGGREFELYAAPGGESEDGIIVWLPQDRTVITGNLFGPIFGNMPNLYTLRGDKIRSAKRFVESLDFVLSLQPEVIVTGHEVFHGADEIAAALQKVRAAVVYVQDYTFDGMNAGKTVHELMRDVALPQDIQVGQAHGKLSWCVRAIWEEYAGWFHYDATTSLYGVPADSVAADIVALAGADALAARAAEHLAAGRPLQALHLVAPVLHAEPGNRAALQVKVDAHMTLMELSGQENFSEVMWLKSELDAAAALLE